MKIRGKRILIISPEPWGTNFVSKHHYAITLAERGNVVYFLNPPKNRALVNKIRDNLFLVEYKPLFRGLARMPSIVSALLTKIQITKLEGLCNTKFDIVWNFDSSSFFNLKRLTGKLRISHIVDLSENKNIKLLNSNVDLGLTVTDFILQRQREFNKNSFNIGHGCNISNSSQETILPKTKNLKKVGYVGNLLIRYLDWELMYKTVTKNPEISFYFAGPYTESNLSSNSRIPKFLQATMTSQNAIFLGSIRPEQIQSFLSQLDVLLLIYKPQKYKEQLANPHKLMEYLASGKVTVASWTDEFKDKRYLLEMVKENEMLPAKFKEVIQNLDKYNNSNTQRLRKEWAREHSYGRQIEKIEKILNDLYNKT